MLCAGALSHILTLDFINLRKVSVMASVLLLNASYEPLDVITWKHALSLMLRERVVAVCDDAIEIQSVSKVFPIPTVLRLRRYVNVPRRNAHWHRVGVLKRDRYTCAYCGRRPGDRQGSHILGKQDFTVDHIWPVSRGGKNTWGNTICACARCNQRKADRTPHEANMKLRWEPKTPRSTYLVASGEIPTAWKAYLAV